MVRPPIARFALPGMAVRHNDLRIPLPHIIQSVKLQDSRYLITTNQGEWEFRPEESVVFPRRADGSIRDWRGIDQLPKARDLAIGDLLDPVIGALDPNDPQTTEKALLESAQIVTAVTNQVSRPWVITVNTYSAWEGVRRWPYEWDELIKFPRTPKHHRPTGYDSLNAANNLVGYGPYLLREAAGDYMIFYVTHPAGGGRWPVWLDKMIRLDDDVYLSKPPGKKSWPEYYGEDRWGRHPRDPMWGNESMATTRDRARVEHALQIYQTYTERRERSST